jgi:hypothetical protein
MTHYTDAKLLPCPFCGGVFVMCASCGCQSGSILTESKRRKIVEQAYRRQDDLPHTTSLNRHNAEGRRLWAERRP